MSAESRALIEQQMAAFLASGGQITSVETIDNPLVAEAAFHNAGARCHRAKRRRYWKSKKKPWPVPKTR